MNRYILWALGLTSLSMSVSSAKLFDADIPPAITKAQYMQIDNSNSFILSDDAVDKIFTQDVVTTFDGKKIERSSLKFDYNYQLNPSQDSLNKYAGLKMDMEVDCKLVFESLQDKKMIDAIANFHKNTLNNAFTEMFHKPFTNSFLVNFDNYTLEYYVSVMPAGIDNDVVGTCGVIKRYQ